MARCLELRLLTVKDLATLFQRSTAWVHDQMKSGDLPYVRMGRSIRFEPAQIEEYLKDRLLNAY